MIILILRVIIYYLLEGMLFVLAIYRDIDDLIDLTKNASKDGHDISDVPTEQLRSTFIIMLTLLWPVFAYQLSNRNR